MSDPARDYQVGPPEPELSLEEFQTLVRGHLTEALRCVPDVVPKDVFDKAAEPMMTALNELDELLYGLGQEERLREQAETQRQRLKVARKTRPEIERCVMRLDRRVQKCMEMLGAPEASLLLGPMNVDLAADAFVRFLEQLDARFFAEDRIVPGGFPSERDPRVAAVIAAMRIKVPA